MFANSIQKIAQDMMAPHKGLLAADASVGTMNKRLEAIGVEQDEEQRRRYRQLLFTTEGIEKYISGVILYDGTIRQQTDDGTPMSHLLERRGIIPGIKVDEGKIDMPYFPGEKFTQGLDGLGGRLKEYYEMGARFAKWRAVIPIGEDHPAAEAITANATSLALYAALCQENAMVPIVEPEVLLHGDHSIDRCDEVVRETMRIVFGELARYRVDPTGTILKTSMVLSGKDAPQRAAPEQVAHKTLDALLATVPRNIPGVVFLSGGQAPEEATSNLNAIAKISTDAPWPLTFSYSRALQEPVLTAWRGLDEHIEEAQRIFLHRCKMNAHARDGTYSPELEHKR